jgi:hypothetical protein
LVCSFAAVVLALKIILEQQDLDKPFTGGLGSYKLYILVAYHIQQHLELGGLDRPGEVFLSFLFRYGNVGGHNVDARTLTDLSQQASVHDREGCTADLSNVFQLEHCVHLFRRCWARLWKFMSRASDKNEGSDPMKSLLAEIVDSSRLYCERSERLQRAAVSVEKLKFNIESIIPERPHEQVTTAAASARGRKRPPEESTNASVNNKLAMPTELTAVQLLLGYNIRAKGDLRNLKRVKRKSAGSR